MDKFATLHTDIQNDAIPTCVCEKSLADKVEKGCLRCGSILGAAMPEMGSIGGSLLSALSAWKPVAIEAAEKAAVTEATDLATQAGMREVVLKIEQFLKNFSKPAVDLKLIVTSSTYNNGAILQKNAMELASSSCDFGATRIRSTFCSTIQYGVNTNFGQYAEAGIAKYDATYTLQKEALETANVDMVKATYASCQTVIIASIVAIIVIVLVMVIIYLILRHRRKKKMKKKLQYIKLLEE
ncbi:surface antigen [Plasmodium falciparum UGT5.1]|uniref:Surface antigen n=1 Tax=Plasmodium falciparum UGT5.1 TaxID=1237627 RepID=W7JVL9_PLAFA|nr:surface antigen [Plasmodium falciparum UGT5.1]